MSGVRTGVVGPGAEQLWGDANTLLLLCCVSSAYLRPRGGCRTGPGGELGKTWRLQKDTSPRGRAPGVAYQPRFRQSKVMTPFSSGVHLMPGEKKASLREAAPEPQAGC